MLWEISGSLAATELSDRADEIRSRLERCSDQELLRFHRESVVAFRSIFRSSTYHLYCAVFDGVVNGMGLVDFCDNVMLAGREIFEIVSNNPDAFSALEDVESFNDEYSVSFGNVCHQVLSERYDEDEIDRMFIREMVPTLDGIWDSLNEELGEPDFNTDWEYVRRNLPSIFEKYATES